MRSRLLHPSAGLLVTVILAAGVLQARTGQVTSPKEQFGFEIGDDYQLANYKQLTDYWKKLDEESDRMTLVDIGQTEEGRAQYMAIITSPENHKRLARYKEIARKLALAEELTDDQARALAAEGKAVVWIDGGLHATEVLGAQQLVQTVYEMISKNDPETQRFLRDVILLAVHANPDGHDLVANWYMREKDPTKRSTAGVPRLYEKYAGHDNNRDSYMANLKETENMNRILFLEWFPQIMYNHHQSGDPGTVLFAPPFRDPFNYVLDPLVPLGIDLVGAAMHNRFVAEGKPGATMRRGADYSTWWNGGLRTTVYYHNMIGLLTETIGHPTPIEIPFVPRRQLPSGDLPYPVAPQKWHFRQSVAYSLTANRAVLDVASRHRENFLYNIYLMGKNSIERGSRDNWTMSPKRLDAVKEAIGKQGGASPRMTDGDASAPLRFYEMLRDPAQRDPRGYILPADQPDFLTATKFVNVLIKNGITIHRATAPFAVNGKSYPAGSFVVKTAQAFRPHVLDMFEPQDHPNDFQYPGGPPIPPYDSAGWTLAYQMGVEFDRILDGFDGPFERLTGLVTPAPGQVTETAGAAGYVFSQMQNDAFTVINRLLKNGDELFRLTKPLAGVDAGLGPAANAPGAFYVQARPQTLPVLKKAATDLGVSFAAVSSRPDADALKLRPVRIGLWDRYGGSMPSGWVRLILERFEFPFEVVFPQTLDAGNLRAKYDVLIFVDGGIPEREGGGSVSRGRALVEPSAESIPAEYRATLGRVTIDKTVPQLKAFLEQGGTVLTIGSSTSLASHLKLPIADALVERTTTGVHPLPQDKFYVPGSVLEVSVDTKHPLAYGLDARADVFFDHSPVFRLLPEAALKGVKPVAWFASEKPLRSGWAWGQHHLHGGVAVAEAPVGKGRLFLFGPEITFRAQPHGTFKFLFNGILYGPAVSGTTATALPTSAQAAR
jgi:Zinc carboxypeptidase